MRPADEPRFSAGIALFSWLVAFVLATLGSALVLAATGYAGKGIGDYPLWLVAILQVPLWLCLVGAAVIVSRWFGTGNLRDDYGFEVRAVDVLGFPIGVVAQLVFVPALYWLLSPVIDRSKVSEAAQQLSDKAKSPVGVLLLIVLVVVGAPIIEELFFRGLLMRSLETRWTEGLAILGSALLFGLAHLQLIQLPALVLFGLVLGYLAQRTGRLGMSIFAHAGFNATTVYLLLR